MYKVEQPLLDRLANQVKHALDVGPIAARRMSRAEWLLQEMNVQAYLQPNSRYIDIGAGKGYVSMVVQRQNVSNNISIFSLDMLDYPTNRVRRNMPTRFVFGDGKKLPVGSGLFDGAFLFFVLHHERDQLSLLKEAGRIVRPGGFIFIAEDTPVTDEDRQKTLSADTKFNAPLWKHEEHRYRSGHDWRQIFGEQNFYIVHEHQFKSGEVTHTFFVLQTSGHRASYNN